MHTELERFITHSTYEESCTNMNAYMSLQVNEVVERFVAIITRKRTLSTMIQNMQLKGILMFERLFTDVT